MSEAALAAVSALDNKAYELENKGHYARALELRREAVAAAQALGFADCLITACLQLAQIDTWLRHSAAVGELEAGAQMAQHGGVELLRAAAATLQRRKAAGTLLPRACRPTEEAWHAAKFRHHSAVHQGPRAALQMRDYCAADDAPLFGPFHGYEVYLTASSWAAKFISWLHQQGGDTSQLLQLVVSGVDLMLQPQTQHELIMPAEVVLLDTFRLVERARLFDSDSVGATDSPVLLDAWSRLQRSGVLRERGLEQGGNAAERYAEAWNARLATQQGCAVLRKCALEACVTKEVHAAQFKKCAACQGAVYCCKQHQEQHCPAHKAACKAARKAAAQGGAGPSSVA
jgi:hypothetical protein